jgi:hypothetical protein
LVDLTNLFKLLIPFLDSLNKMEIKESLISWPYKWDVPNLNTLVWEKLVTVCQRYYSAERHE